MKDKKTWEELMQEIADQSGITVMVRTKDKIDLYMPKRRKGGESGRRD